MADRRVAREIELFPQQWEMFDQITKALGHDDEEETLKLLLEMGWKAVGVTDTSNRSIKIIGGFRREIGEPCRTCGHQRIAYERETTVTLGVSGEKDIPQSDED